MAESNDMLGQGCGCRIQGHGTVITYCPLHKAAPEYRDELERVVADLDKIMVMAADTEPGSLPHRMGMLALRSADKARGQEVG